MSIYSWIVGVAYTHVVFNKTNLFLHSPSHFLLGNTKKMLGLDPLLIKEIC